MCERRDKDYFAQVFNIFFRKQKSEEPLFFPDHFYSEFRVAFPVRDRVRLPERDPFLQLGFLCPSPPKGAFRKNLRAEKQKKKAFPRLLTASARMLPARACPLVS
jgi:hypothetical protein